METGWEVGTSFRVEGEGGPGAFDVVVWEVVGRDMVWKLEVLFDSKMLGAKELSC